MVFSTAFLRRHSLRPRSAEAAALFFFLSVEDPISFGHENEKGESVRSAKATLLANTDNDGDLCIDFTCCSARGCVTDGKRGLDAHTGYLLRIGSETEVARRR